MNAVRLAVLPAIVAAFPILSAHAAEVRIDGAYQARARLFDTLSLSRDYEQAEGFAWTFQHRLWLRPKLYVTDQIGAFLDIRALDNVAFGSRRNAWLDPVTQLPVAGVLSDDLVAPAAGDDGINVDFTLWRAWAEVNTKFGTFKIGRQPLHWGLGVWQNDGTGTNQEYGDSADRVSWEHVVQDVWVRAAVDINATGLVNQTDETWSLNLAGAYRTERIDGGVQFQYRRSNASGEQFDLFTLDGAVDLQFGFIGVAAEGVFQFGNGDLPGGFNDVRYFGAGGAADVSLSPEKFDVHVGLVWATGDGDATDGTVNTFTLDRDFNTGFLMFEQPMPVLASAVPGEERSFAVTQTGNAISNAIILRPSFSYMPVRGLWIDATASAAWTAATVPAVTDAGRAGNYGVEIDAGLRWLGTERLEVWAHAGVFVPGAFYTNYRDETFANGFTGVAAGGQLLTRVHF